MLKKTLLIALISFTLCQSLIGAYEEQEINLNYTSILAPINRVKQDLTETKEYSESSYNFYPLSFYTQESEGINSKIFLAVQSKGSSDIDLYAYVIHSDYNTDELTVLQDFKVRSEDDTEKFSKNEMYQEKIKDGLSRYFFEERLSIVNFSLEKYYKNIFNHVSFYLVSARVGKKKQVENLVLIEREDRTFEVAAHLKLN